MTLYDHYDSPVEAVRSFHLAFGIPVAEKTELPDNERRELRIRLLQEEFFEYLEAEHTSNLVEIADALGDLIYIACGTALTYGIKLDAVFREIHRSNMAKLQSNGKPRIREDGKVLKPEGWTPPDIESVMYL